MPAEFTEITLKVAVNSQEQEIIIFLFIKY